MQLNLFVDYKPTARVFSFPADRRVTEAHAIAQELVELDFDRGKARWQLVCREFKRMQRRKGFSVFEIRAAVDQLAEDVHRSIDRLNLLKQYKSPAVIFSLTGHRLPTLQHGDGVGAAGAQGQGTKFLGGLGAAHERAEFDAARAHDGGAA